MLGATAIAVFFIPMFFLVLEKLGTKRSDNKEAPGDKESGIKEDDSDGPMASQIPDEERRE
jgi:multidrug efflux pump